MKKSKIDFLHKNPASPHDAVMTEFDVIAVFVIQFNTKQEADSK